MQIVTHFEIDEVYFPLSPYYSKTASKNKGEAQEVQELSNPLLMQVKQEGWQSKQTF